MASYVPELVAVLTGANFKGRVLREKWEFAVSQIPVRKRQEDWNMVCIEFLSAELQLLGGFAFEVLEDDEAGVWLNLNTVVRDLNLLIQSFDC